MSRALGGSCEVPLGAYAVIENDELWLRAFVALPDGSRMVRTDGRSALADAEALGSRVAQTLRDEGADAILAELG